ncbi:nucleotidyltransferase domain-containing protein [Candidatus Woesearchaeota archaeon]|nr:nucleotidyltransferase domain-containing protein [Candidatus Woesearchaeota archaeon]
MADKIKSEKLRKILDSVLLDIKPSMQEEKDLNARISSFVAKIQKQFSNNDAKVFLGGSGAKGTWLKNSYDADIFVMFNYKKFADKSMGLSDILEKRLKAAFKGKKISRIHGSRDYFQAIEKVSKLVIGNKSVNGKSVNNNPNADFTFEIVPILDIKQAKEAKNITDVSPLHASWVKKNSNEKLRDDIRLAKQFCKSTAVYGAESYINGFSGYILEILVIYHKGFTNLLNAASKWPLEINQDSDKVIIDLKKYYKNKTEVLFNVNKAKTHSPLIVIDPVQKDRNAAAALSDEQYRNFILAAKKFLAAPSKDFFEVKEITLDALKKQETANKRLYALEASSLAGKRDVVGAKLMKAFEHIKTKLADNHFNLHHTCWSWDKKKTALFWFFIDGKKLDPVIIQSGPPVALKKHAAEFKKKYKKTFVKDNRLYAKAKRKYVDAGVLLKDAVNDLYVKERVKGIRVVYG